MLEMNYISLVEAVRRMCLNDEACQEACSKFVGLQALSEKDLNDLLEVLANLLLNQRICIKIAHEMPEILPHILSRALSDSTPMYAIGDVSRRRLHERRCVTLSKLAYIHPDVVMYALKYFERNPSPFHNLNLSDEDGEPKAKRRRKFSSSLLTPVTDEELVSCCYSFLKFKTNYFLSLWDWSIFMKKFFHHENRYVQWLACHCFFLLLKMGSHERETLLTSRFSANEIVDFTLKSSNEEETLRKPSSKFFAGVRDTCETSPPIPQVKNEGVISVAGITLPISSRVPESCSSNLVLVRSTERNLQAIALGIATGKTLCLQGPVGCGKTALVEHLAKQTGRGSPPSFLSIQLGDQTDSKMLLGTYQCTDIPGEFVWKPGVLTQAVLGGYWLLLEDIDSCTTDVAAVLSSLLETGSLGVPGYKDCVQSAPGFQLFFTQRLMSGATGLHKIHNGVTGMLQRHWLTVQMEPLSEPELVDIVQTLHPSLTTVASRMVDVFLLFSAGSHHTALSGNEGPSDQQNKTIKLQTVGARLPSTRDLIKWCNRSSQAFNVSSPESGLKLFQDALDIFCCNVSNPATRLSLAESIAGKLGIIHTKAEYFCNTHKPVICSSASHLVAGRISLPRQNSDRALLKAATKATFSFTRPASALLERVASCIHHSEPVLLVGETGVGKTSSIQYLAHQMGQSLSVINMNQQSDSADLLGGYKPVEMKFIIAPIRDEFENLFRNFFSGEKNAKFLSHIASCFSMKKWSKLIELMKHSTAAALKRFEKNQSSTKVPQQHLSHTAGLHPQQLWTQLSVKLHRLEEQVKKSQNALAFAFVEGSLVKALKEGHWVLLDEINLASAQTLECLSSLLEGATGSLYLLERGDECSIKRHPNFRIFAAMNPATDVGKKELPPGIRNRFTEFFVDELVDRQDLLLLCSSYLASLALPASKLEAIVRFYLSACQEAISSLSDGTGQKPHYSLRTLCRALSVAASNPCGSVPRSLYEGILLSFLTQLDRSSHPIVEEMVAKAVIGKNSTDPKSLIKQPIPAPTVSGKTFVQVEGYWVTQGPLEPNTPEKYIMTKTVRRNLRDLVRVVSLARLPILLQGETSVGKTSLITFLAQLSGNCCLRINNHEHTDLQEYIGCYAADERGNLVFKEGVLVEAMKYGHWVILDELNLAPSDVLEALNRVLDDNRELFIPETQKVVKAHPNFMLFATQNPPGIYGGRKVLSRAFRNRFIELHFDEIPPVELETILHLRCDMPPSYCKKMVAVMSDLQVRRKGSATFAGKQGFITLRDLFRWGERYRLARQVEQGKYYDWDQHIADEGYLILAGRVRKEEERFIIQDTLKKFIKRTVDPQKLFTLSADTSPVTRHILEALTLETPTEFKHIVWTYNMRRLAALLGKACEFNEPILLVGETGCGKTTLCQLLAASRKQNLASVNCHMHSESADFLGGLRPVREHTEEKRGKLFEWVDGPLIEAMMSGRVFLADEISLADDSVLERLNSLLEPERKLLLTEKGTDTSGSPCEVTAQDGFIFVGTMNPGGDYGKKELSPALRNRFTEIWCEGCTQRDDLIAIIEHNLRPNLVFKTHDGSVTSVGVILLDFLQWFAQTDLGSRSACSIRDIMTWVEFINVCSNPSVNLNLASAYIHGACLTFLDSLGTGLTSFSTKESVASVRIAALEFLRNQVKMATSVEPASTRSFMTLESYNELGSITTAERFGIHPFYVPRGSPASKEDANFLLSAPTTHLNAVRLLRGLQLGKALLLEGSPGVGKTSLVAALAQASGYKLTRINLSDQTDISDLFGADLPVEGGLGGQFAWRDGPFLQALKAGHWILLDELNLASQSVLEGLNAVLDHRGDLFIPELGRTFHIQSERTRLFACQNPLNQGGARKGLPQSFLNRFTQVHMETLTSDDLEYICQALYPTLPPQLIKSMVMFNQHAASETGPGGKWGQRGAPWEMNLRDLSRWCEISVWGASNGALNPGRFVQLLYIDRMRTLKDKEEMKELYCQSFSKEYPLVWDIPQIHITPSTLYLGDVAMTRKGHEKASGKLVLRHQLPVLQSLARCVSLGWLSILVGPTGSGKTSLVHLLAQLAGRDLKTLAVNSAMDTIEILGGFEQADYKRHLDELSTKVGKILTKAVNKLTLVQEDKESNHLLHCWQAYLQSDKNTQEDEAKSFKSEMRLFSVKIDLLIDILYAIPKSCTTLEDQEEVFCLHGKLQHLKECFSRDNSLNAGGKFEWVDSILVKSLTEGCWLLVDNVNLCSAAVLDRLNGLLEPKGVLTISERGVTTSGELVTITPHPDFRLFLTMDPKYGEISRAMRNRGVEIYVTACEGDMTTTLSQLDVAALLSDLGVSKQHDQEVLLNTHHVMLKTLNGPDPPGLTELLHASYLFIQQVQRGMSPIPSLLSSFTKVYIQSRLSDSIDSKRRSLVILEEAVASGAVGSSCIALDNLVRLSTLKTSDIYLDPCLAIIKQRCAVLSAISNAEENDLVKVIQFLGLKASARDVDFSTVLTSLVVFFYQVCSVNDVTLATKWLQREVDDTNHAAIIHQVSELLHETFMKIGDLAACHLLWDRRWLPDVSCALAVLSGVDEQGVENRVSLLLYITAHMCRTKISFDLSSMKSQKTISVLEYSYAVSKGALADTITSESIFIEICPFLEMILNLMNESLTTIGVVVSDEKWLSIRKAFTWITRFQKLAASLCLSPDKNSMAEVLNLLVVHYRWIVKHTIPFVKCLTQSAALDDSSFLSIMAKIDASVSTSNTSLWYVGKRLRRQIGQPLPIASRLQASLTFNAFNIANVFNLWRKVKENDNPALVTHCLSTSEGLLAKASLIAAIKDIISNSDLSGVEEKLRLAENICSNFGLLSSSTVQAEPVPSRSLNTMLWPFLEVICLFASSPLLSKILQGQSISSCPVEYSIFMQALKCAPSIPLELIGFFEALASDNVSNESSRGVTWLFHLANQSSAVSNPQFWIPCDLDFGSDPIGSEEILPQHCPILSRLAASLLFCQKPSSKEQLAMSSLEHHTGHEKLLNNLRTLLWQCSVKFFSPVYSYRENEVKSVVSSTLYFIQSLEKIGDMVSNQGKSLCERVGNITKYFQDKLGDRASSLSGVFELLMELIHAIEFVTRVKSIENDALMQVGIAWTFLGCIETQLFSAFPKIDPTSKHAIKHQYTTEEILGTRSELFAAEMMGTVLGVGPGSLPSHQHVKILENDLSLLEQQSNSLSREVALRPEPSQYFALTKELEHCANSLSSLPVVMKLTKRILSILKSSSKSDVLIILKEAQTWLLSQKSFVKMLDKRFGVWYPDIVAPVLASHSKLIRGIELMVGISKKVTLSSPTSPHHSTLSKLVCSLGSFPSLSPEQPSIMNLLSNLANRHSPFIIEQMLQTVVGKTPDLQHRAQTEAFWLLKSALMELKNYLCFSKSCKSDEWNALVKVLRSFMCIWEKQETERREREQDNESLYKSRGAVRCQTISEDDEAKDEIKEMFPSRRQTDFGDLEPTNTLEGPSMQPIAASSSSALSIMMDDDDVALVSSVHMSLALAFSKSVWMDCTSNSSNISPDFLSAWMQRCAVTARLISLCSHILDDYVDKSLLSSWILASHIAAPRSGSGGNSVSITSENPSFDFYRTPCIHEVKQCKPVLEGLLARVNELLSEWPEHPTLNQIATVVNRITSFSIESPLARFLTGLEILLNKIKEWEENAHSGVSLASHSTAVTHLIIQWRRVELTCWKSCLNAAALKMQKKASRWWFYIFSLVDSFVHPPPDKTPVNGKDIVSSLQKFMEEAPLGEFKVRLDMVLAFHCHVANMAVSCHQKELQSVLWNLHKFYSQFQDKVDSRIVELRSPIEKKLKDYVKIARWNDINYWAVKDAVFKTQRTLHKHVKEFESVLKQSVKSTMLSSQVEGKVRSPTPTAPLNPRIYVASNVGMILCDLSGSDTKSNDFPLVQSAGSYFNRSKKLTKDIILASASPGRIAALNEFANNVAESVQQLASIEVDRSIPKSKQVSQAKNQLQMKRKALADLFRMLQHIGLSYHKGLTFEEDDLKHEFTQLPPLDVSVYINSLNKATGIFTSSNKADQEILNAWNGCGSYFMRSWARFAQLTIAIRNPHKDHGPPNIERIRGFPAHLLNLTHTQHLKVYESTNLMAQMRLHLFHLKSMEEFMNSSVPSQTKLHLWDQRLKSLLVSSLVTLEQVKLLLDACPDSEAFQGSDENISVIIHERTHPCGVLGAIKADFAWIQAVEMIDKTLSYLHECQSRLNSDCSSLPSHFKSFMTVSDFKKMSDSFQTILMVCDLLFKVESLFQQENSLHPHLQSLTWLREHMVSECHEFFEMCKANPEGNSASSLDVSKKANDLIQNILLGVQRLYKDHTNIDEELLNSTSNTDLSGDIADKKVEDIDDYDLEEKHLSDGILKALASDFDNLCVEGVGRSLDALMNDVYSIFHEGGQSCARDSTIRMALQVVPLLQQWLLLYQFIVQQQIAAYRTSAKLLSILLAVLGDVTAKGFCMPEDLMSSDEVGEGEGQSDGKQDGSMGLGDGEGEKDVSDRIESEDQLEDAQPAGEEKKNEDKDCQEEEKGIEMSDNFDGKLQDMEPKDNEDNEDDDKNDDNDAEKEMGDTEKDADKLDEQVWGSDSEEDSGDEGDGDEEEGNSGEKSGEKEMGARDHDAKNGDRNDDAPDENGEKGDNQENKPDINEMKEPEVDDDHVDPYHGNQKPEVEPDVLDLPEDMKLDDGEEKENEEGTEENPFDVDEMKEKQLPEVDQKDDNKEENNDEEGKNENERSGDESSDDDMIEPDKGDADFEEPAEDGETENVEDSDERKNGQKQEDVEDETKEDNQEGEKDENDDRNPSSDDPSSGNPQTSEDTPQGSMDQVSSTSEVSQETSGEKPEEEADGDPGGEDREAVGQAPANKEMQGHQSDHSGKRPQRDQHKSLPEEDQKRQRPGHSDEQRSLGDVKEPVKKRLKTVDIKQTDDEDDGQKPEDDTEDADSTAELYQHIKDVKEQSSTQTLDAATKEQADKQQVASNEEEEATPENDEAMDIDHNETSLEDCNEEKRKSEETSSATKAEKQKKDQGKLPPQTESEEAETSMEVEGAKVDTLGVMRAPETTFHTRFEELALPSIVTIAQVEEQSEAVRQDLQNQLASWNVEHAGEEASKAWQSLSSLTNSLARDLCEQLRLVLEPTQATRMKGDFRTGRRINMRKVIPYIASQFRKDKIWMRRTKPSKREYQILLAIDDSSSMADNRSKELAFESLALVSQALTLLEVGELGVLSFGEAVKVLHKLGEPFTQFSGARLLQQFSFDQRKTQVGVLVDYANSLFSSSKAHTSAEHAQLLVVISDGRGVFSEGQEKVNSCVRKARLAGIFMVFVIIDNPESKDSILDIRTPLFSGGKLLGISSYMDSFPFPFYLILRDISNLPAVLSDALRQWFELVSNTA